MGNLNSPLFLIGLPGAGKTTLGQLLSKKLKLPFVDLDDLIVQKERMAIKDIFKKMGEDYFRKIEKECLAAFLQTKQSAIVSVGGGTPCFFDNLNKMKEAGKTCYLKTSWKVLASRAVMDSKRPLFADLKQENLEKSLEDKFSWRLPFYDQANIIIETNAKDADEIANELITQVNKEIKGC